VTTRTQESVCNPDAKASHGEPVSSFSHSGDILGGSKKLNGSRDDNHASFGCDSIFFGNT